MYRYILFLFLLACTNHVDVQLNPTPVIHDTCPYSNVPFVFVNGQSNATAGYWSQAVIYDSPNLLTYDGAKWVPAHAEQGGDNLVGTGPWAAEVTKSLSDSSGEVGRVINGGELGQKIAHFLPTSNEVALLDGPTLDPQGRNNYKLQLDFWQSSGFTPHLLVWDQGEADGGRSSADQRADLETLYAEWKKDYPKVERFVIVETPNIGCSGNSQGVREAEEGLANFHEDVYLVNTDDLTDLPPSKDWKDSQTFDGCHFKFPGYQEIGKRVLAKVY